MLALDAQFESGDSSLSFITRGERSRPSGTCPRGSTRFQRDMQRPPSEKAIACESTPVRCSRESGFMACREGAESGLESNERSSCFPRGFASAPTRREQ